MLACSNVLRACLGPVPATAWCAICSQPSPYGTETRVLVQSHGLCASGGGKNHRLRWSVWRDFLYSRGVTTVGPILSGLKRALK